MKSKFIFEEEEKSFKQEKKHESFKTIKDMLSMPYEEFIKVLKDNADDERINTILNLGQKDGIPTDEVVKVTYAEYTVKQLLPTQNAIGIGQSLYNIVHHFPQNISVFINSKEAVLSERRILTANGKYIIDGHHRWSGVFLFNPNAKISAINLEIPGISDTKSLLKIVQLAIAAAYKNVYSKEADIPTDIFNESLDKEKIKTILKKELDENAINICKKEYKFNSDEEVINKITNNALFLKKYKPADSPDRKYMPQPSDAAKVAGKKEDDVKGIPSGFLKTLQTGKLNFKKPFINPNPKAKETVTQESYFISLKDYKRKLLENS
jgi:hypothetical protein